MDIDKKGEKMQSGARAGLSNLKDLKKEAKQLKRKQNESMRNLPDDVSGRNAKVVYRDRKTGQVRNLDKEKEQKDIQDAKDNEKRAVYDRWNKGVVQTEERKEKLESDLHEMSKPLARYKDDEDLESYLKDQELADDPMMMYMKEKKIKEKKARDPSFKVYPKYKGPPPQRNRFDIEPGYRWDGVNRSNGYEAKYFEQLNLKRAQEEEAYKWSTEDM